jgi:hypothetical protein
MCILISQDCGGQPAIPKYKNLKVYVIGRARSYAEATKYYWLVDGSVYPDLPLVGDTFGA